MCKRQGEHLCHDGAMRRIKGKSAQAHTRLLGQIRVVACCWVSESGGHDQRCLIEASIVWCDAVIRHRNLVSPCVF
jgi:hypothetical protein